MSAFHILRPFRYTNPLQYGQDSLCILFLHDFVVRRRDVLSGAEPAIHPASVRGGAKAVSGPAAELLATIAGAIGFDQSCGYERRLRLPPACTFDGKHWPAAQRIVASQGRGGLRCRGAA